MGASLWMRSEIRYRPVPEPQSICRINVFAIRPHRESAFSARSEVWGLHLRVHVEPVLLRDCVAQGQGERAHSSGAIAAGWGGGHDSKRDMGDQ